MTANRCWTSFFVILVLFSPACGKKGPLVLEKPVLPPAVEKVELHQLGEQLVVSWRFPLTLSDGSSTWLKQNLQRLDLFYSEHDLPAQKLARRANLLGRFSPQQLEARQDGSYQAVFPLKGKKLSGQRHAVVIQYRYDRFNSPPSNVVYMISQAPPEAVTGLKVEAGRRSLILSWEKPEKDTSGRPLEVLSGFKVYRRYSAGPGREERDFLPQVEKPLLADSFIDKNVRNPGEYQYFVTALRGSQVESSPSQVISFTLESGFPPDPPANLVIFQASDHLFLNWRALPESSFSHYRVYRRRSAADQFELLADQVRENLYRDRSVRPGQSFEYALSAVDENGNESELSSAVRETFRSD